MLENDATYPPRFSVSELSLSYHVLMFAKAISVGLSVTW